MPTHGRERAAEVRNDLRVDLDRIRRDVRRLNSSAADGLADSHPSIPRVRLRFAADGLSQPLLRWVSDAPKATESADTATGCYLYYDPASDSWLRVGTDVPVYRRSEAGMLVFIVEESE